MGYTIVRRCIRDNWKQLCLKAGTAGHARDVPAKNPGCACALGSTVVSPYVGMARKQNGGYNVSISVQTLIFHLLVNSTRLKTV